MDLVDWGEAISSIGHGFCVSVLLFVAARQLRGLIPRWIARVIYVTGVVGCVFYGVCASFAVSFSIGSSALLLERLGRMLGWVYTVCTCLFAFALMALGRHVKMAYQQLEGHEQEVG